MKKYALGLISVLMLVSSLAEATAKSEDFQSWNALTATGPFSNPNYRYWLEGQLRLGDDVHRVTQTFFRPAIGYTLSEKSSAWIGYGWFYTSFPLAIPSNQEQRLWEQFLWNTKLKNDIPFSSRTRLEQRRTQGSDQIGWRFREAIRFLFPVPQHPKYFIAAGDEIFIHLRNPSTDKFDPSFDQNRLAVGLGKRFTKEIMAEVGYIYQRIKSFDDDPHFTGNIVAINVNMQFS
jgi:hypothetical protein